VDLPRKGERVSLDEIRAICAHYGLAELWSKIEQDPPQKTFSSDGCSCWFDSWRAHDLYPACFIHDLHYWAGYPDGRPGENIARLIADAELMIEVARRMGETTMAEIMFHGVRVGGHQFFKQGFSWGFGRT